MVLTTQPDSLEYVPAEESVGDTNITSHNQSGGVTAHTVAASPGASRKKRGVFTWVVGIATIVAAVAAVAALLLK